MKRSASSHYPSSPFLAALASFGGVVLLAIGFFWFKPAGLEPPTPTPNAPQIEARDEREDVEGRLDWFYFQRAYPFDSVPADARRLAWQARPRPDLRAAQQAAWQPIGPGPTESAFPNNWGLTSGRINAIAVSPADPNVMLVGAATGGIWRSADGGANFKPVSDTQVDLAVGSIVFAPSNSNIVYVGMGDAHGGAYLGTGVLKSIDSGQTWTRVSNSSLPAGTISRIQVNPANPNEVYVAQYNALSGNTFFSSGCYRSTDGGVSWTRTLTGLARDLAVHPSAPGTVYLAMSRVDQGGLPAGATVAVKVTVCPLDETGDEETTVVLLLAFAQTAVVNSSEKARRLPVSAAPKSNTATSHWPLPFSPM